MYLYLLFELLHSVDRKLFLRKVLNCLQGVIILHRAKKHESASF